MESFVIGFLGLLLYHLDVNWSTLIYLGFCNNSCSSLYCSFLSRHSWFRRRSDQRWSNSSCLHRGVGASKGRRLSSWSLEQRFLRSSTRSLHNRSIESDVIGSLLGSSLGSLGLLGLFVRRSVPRCGINCSCSLLHHHLRLLHNDLRIHG